MSGSSVRPSPSLGGLLVLLLAVASWSCGGPDAERAPEPWSVLLVSPDSLRADRLPALDPEAAASTPHFDRLVAGGTLFTNAWATSPWTAPSMVSIMTGHYPPAHGVAYRDDTTPAGLPTLPSLLEERGYEVGNFSFFSQISYFRNLGLGPAEEGLRHDRVPEAFATWLDGLGAEQPFFAWVHLLETHLPYGATGYRASEVSLPGSSGLEASQLRGTVPLGSAEFEEGDRAALLELYDRDVEAMDQALGTILDALERSGWRERTLVIFVADHGEELLDGDVDEPWVGHASTAVEARLLPQILRVPLVVAGPGIPSGLRVDDLVQPVDAAATLRRLLDIDDLGSGELPPLPGLHEESWLERLWPGPPRRELAYFDSSPGGNLTPAELRGHRLQGVTDGRCLLVDRVEPGETSLERMRPVPPLVGEHPVGTRTVQCAEVDRRRLDRALERWRADQARTRLALLRGEEKPPDPEVVDAWAVGLELTEPARRELTFEGSGGQIRLDWRGGTADDDDRESGGAWIEYRLTGSGADLIGGVRGAFRVDQRGVTFGPVPAGFWNDLASYSPIEVRLVDDEAEQRSEWQTFELAETR